MCVTPCAEVVTERRIAGDLSSEAHVRLAEVAYDHGASQRWGDAKPRVSQLQLIMTLFAERQARHVLVVERLTAGTTAHARATTICRVTPRVEAPSDLPIPAARCKALRRARVRPRIAQPLGQRFPGAAAASCFHERSDDGITVKLSEELLTHLRNESPARRSFLAFPFGEQARVSVMFRLARFLRRLAGLWPWVRLFRFLRRHAVARANGATFADALFPVIHGTPKAARHRQRDSRLRSRAF